MEKFLLKLQIVEKNNPESWDEVNACDAAESVDVL